MFLKITKAIQYLYSIGLYIINLHPSNIVFDNNENPKLDIFAFDFSDGANFLSTKNAFGNMSIDDTDLNLYSIIASIGLTMLSVITGNAISEEVITLAYDAFINDDDTFGNLEDISVLDWDHQVN